MTDKEKIRAEIVRHLKEDACGDEIAVYNELLSFIDSMQEEPKKCMYSKDDFTDEDRKVLCDGCEAECIEKVKEEHKRDLSLWSLGDFKNNFFEIIKPYKDSHNYKNLCIRLAVWRSELWRWIDWKKRKEEPVSEDLEEAANDYAVTVYNNYLDNPKAFENKDADTLNEDAFKAGAKWQKQQIKKSMDLGEPPYLISVEQAYYRTVKLLED